MLIYSDVGMAAKLASHYAGTSTPIKTLFDCVVNPCTKATKSFQSEEITNCSGSEMRSSKALDSTCDHRR